VIAEILGRRFRTLKNPGNLNNEIGLPLTLLRLTEGHEAAVLAADQADRALQGDRREPLPAVSPVDEDAAASDPYGVYSTRSTLDFKEGLMGHMLELFPFLDNVTVLRQWAGIADMTPDFSPVMGLTPVENYYIDSGWGTWGFKATPVCGMTMAHTIVHDEPHDLIKPFYLDRFVDYAQVGEKGAASVGH
jgi:glycine/D-amino acid oxidase-like deaminating enzyme